MTLQLQLAVVGCCVLTGCRTTQLAVTRETVVGAYVYKSEDPEGRATDHNLDHLVLRSDGKYDLVEGGSTKPRSETIGTWTLWNGGGNGPRVILDRAGYPVEVKGNKVRLLVDNDVGIWYEKAK